MCYKIGVIFSLLACSFLSGCATVTGSSTQNLAVEARTHKGEIIKDARCKLSNDKGIWYATTPDSLMVQKSAADLHMVCQKDGFEPGITRAVSRANAGMFGNIILGGGIGAIIDHSKGTAYNYPNTLEVVMRQNRLAKK